MRSRLLLVTAMIFGAFSMGFAQSNPSIQLDEVATNTPASLPPADPHLVSMPPVPANEQQQFEQSVKDIHFDFDRSDLRPEDRQILASNAEWLKAHPDVTVVLEGDADDRGDIVYNVVLSQDRAAVTKDALVQMGVPADRIAFATGWGKLYPVCTEEDENCWSQNRRTHFNTWPPEPERTQVAISLAP